jgi:hypothetical protein
VVLTPTYSGCPATEVIEQSVLDAWRRRPRPGDGSARAARRPGPPTGSAPKAAQAARTASRRPGPVAADGACPIRIVRRRPPVACPRCGSAHTERLSAFGSTACKACTAASPAANPSSTSSRSDPTTMSGRTSTPCACKPMRTRHRRGVIVSFDVPARCARPSLHSRASTSRCARPSTAGPAPLVLDLRRRRTSGLRVGVRGGRRALLELAARERWPATRSR